MAPKTSNIPAGKATSSKKPATRGKPPTKPKEPLLVAERLKRLFTSLCAQIDGGHFTNAVRTCDKILRLEPNDADAIQTKLFLLLQTEQYEAALLLATGDEAGNRHAFEKTYALYRLEHESEASAALNAIKQEKGEDRGVLHLEAQLSYRQGDYQTAFDLYNQLLDTAEPRSDEQADILTNLQASQKHLDFINTDFLRGLDSLPASSISTLEPAPPPTQPSTSLSLATVAAPPQDESSKGAAPVKKVRMKRVPKGVVPGVTPAPDPERWLKKSERSTYMQGRGRKKGGGATQGIVTDSASATPGGGSGGGHGQSGKGGGKKKKR